MMEIMFPFLDGGTGAFDAAIILSVEMVPEAEGKAPCDGSKSQTNVANSALAPQYSWFNVT